ncbi:hypothetical protein [Flexibacterium corallicola]|uniref:hypothetical protein n=1 Tax=Flexibacterium corallicola TaxID=3037259 RepID=UPI00286F45DE|nr:hypothetical protein [Pseudovibrio sp. M1P-2-3]
MQEFSNPKSTTTPQGANETQPKAIPRDMAEAVLKLSKIPAKDLALAMIMMTLLKKRKKTGHN